MNGQVGFGYEQNEEATAFRPIISVIIEAEGQKRTIILRADVATKDNTAAKDMAYMLFDILCNSHIDDFKEDPTGNLKLDDEFDDKNVN